MHDIMRWSAEELLTLVQTLEAPGLEEMHGEFAVLLLRQLNSMAALAAPVIVYNALYPGMWLAKAFRPVGAEGGRGYNSFRHFGRVVQRFPMLTRIALSRYDGCPAFQLAYRAFRSYCGFIHMVDEVQRRVPHPFLLAGPVAPYRGDIGTERAGFRVEGKLPARQG